MNQITLVNETTRKFVELAGQRVLTTAQLAESYGTDKNLVTKNFNRNKERYQEGKHFFLLEGVKLKDFRAKTQIDLLKNVHRLYLWTEKGAWLHAKSLNTDKAWDAYELLVDEYYRLVEEVKHAEPQYKLPKNYKEALYMLGDAVEENEELKEQIENNREKVVLANAVTADEEGMLVEAVAKYMRQNGVNIGRDRLFNWLRKNGYLVSRKGREWNCPTQKALNKGLMKIHVQQYYDYEGELKASRQVVVTGKGLMFFLNRILAGNQMTMTLPTI